MAVLSAAIITRWRYYIDAVMNNIKTDPIFSKTNKWVLEKIGSVLMLSKSMSEKKKRFFGHIVRKNGMEKRLMQGKMERKRRRGRPANTWFQDLKEWTKLDIAGASQLATDRERWQKIIKVTAAQIAPPDARERE